MSDLQQKNYRLPSLTIAQLKALVERTGMTETQLIIMALDRLHREEMSKPAEKSN